MSLFKNLANGIHFIHSLENFEGYVFNPLALIKSVNYFQSLGYHESFQILQLYCYLLERIEEQMPNILSNIDMEIADFAREPKKIFMLARLLFMPNVGQNILPKLRLGQPDLEPKDMSLFPWFPLHLYQDIPLCLLMKGYTLFGIPQSPSMYLDWCAKECQFREFPILPENNPLDSVDELLKSEVWKNLVVVGGVEGTSFVLEADFSRMVRLQALRMVSNVYSLSKQDEMKFSGDHYCSEEEINEIWQKHKQAFAKLDIYWNSVINDYEQRNMGVAGSVYDIKRSSEQFC